MKIIIPASGTGERFKKEGYTNFKALLQVTNNKKVMDYVIDAFSKEDDFYIISSEETYNDMETYLETKDISYKHILHEGYKLGPVGAIESAFKMLNKYISKNEEVIVSYCDFGIDWDYKEFKEFIKDKKPDGCVPCYTGYHKHLDKKENVYACCKTTDNFHIYKVLEKYNSNNRYEEYWSPGLYYYSSFKTMIDSFDNMIINKDTVNDEYYSSLSYNYFPENSNILIYSKVNKFYQFGTPSDFEYAKLNLIASEKILNATNNIEIENTVVLSAGKGERFFNLNYNQPKPFLPVGDSTIIDYITKYLKDNTNTNIRYVGSKDHSLFWEDFNVTYVKPNKIGAAYSYKQSCEDLIGEVMIVPCDLLADYFYSDFQEIKKNADAIIFTSNPTEYSINNHKSFAWVSGNNSIVDDISIKHKFNDIQITEQKLLIGSFWIKENSTLIKYIDKIFLERLSVNGEYYLDSAFKKMNDDGLNIKYININDYFSFGTPKEYIESKYWIER